MADRQALTWHVELAGTGLGLPLEEHLPAHLSNVVSGSITNDILTHSRVRSGTDRMYEPCATGSVTKRLMAIIFSGGSLNCSTVEVS
jgi:hypothetical protein